MDGCDEFRRPETYKYNPLEQIFKKSNFEENLLICQLKYKYPLRQFFWVEFWMIKWYGVTVDEITFASNIFSCDCRWDKNGKNIYI